MPSFGETSTRRLRTCHPILQELCTFVVAQRDCFVACGHRGEEAQNAALAAGTSTLGWPDSKHNSLPSLAVDLVPWPEKWGSIPAFEELHDAVQAAWSDMVRRGANKGYRLRWGGDWDGDGNQTDHDLPHWELIK